MEIRYIWIEEYREILEKLDVNFHHRGLHKFSFQNNVLEMLPNDPGVLAFGDKIKGITTIAGKNGSGKSSICEIVLNAAATYVNGHWGWNFPFKGIICFGSRIFYSKHLQLNNREALIANNYELKEFEESPLEQLPFNWRPVFHKASFIYYSNVFDWRSGMDLTNLTNISTEYLIYNDYRTGTSYVPVFDTDEPPNFLDAYYTGQAYRNCKFYLNFSDNIPFKEPNYFVLESSHSGINRYLRYDKVFKYEDYNKFQTLEQQIINRIHIDIESFEPGLSIDTNQQLTKECVMDLYRFNLVIAIALNKRELPDYERSERFILDLSNEFEIFENSEDIRRLVSIHENLVQMGHHQDQFSPQYLRHNHRDDKWKFKIFYRLYINNDQVGRVLLKDFMALEEEILRGSDHYAKRISNYFMHPFPSAGENSYYMFFSRLYDAISRYDIGYDEREDLVIFIDEGEVGFHPAWQKKFLKWLIDFLDQEFNNYKFQIILTTHSPYLLSDLSTENIILLNKHNNRTEIVSSNSYKPFGANINELLSDAFFLTDGLIGEFAKTEIQKVINLLNEWRKIKINLSQDQTLTINEEQRRKCEGIIAIIGDGIVRNKLFEMYWEIFGNDTTIDNEIQYLENRLKQLQERKIR